MKKIIFKLIGAIFCVLISYLIFGSSLKKVLNDEFSFSFIGELFYDTTYTSQMVSVNYIDVLDYKINNDVLEVSFIENKVILPYSGICVKKTKDSVYIEVNKSIIEISNLDKTYLNIYEVFYPNIVIGLSDKTIIKSNDLNILVSKFNIINEKV